MNKVFVLFFGYHLLTRAKIRATLLQQDELQKDVELGHQKVYFASRVPKKEEPS